MKKGARRELGFIGGLLAGALFLFGKKKVAGTLAALAVGAFAWPTSTYAFRKRVIVITGGSRGLGFALARNLVRQGASVVLLARDAEELERAQRALNEITLDVVMTIPCDVTETSNLTAAITEIYKKFERIDVWINDAGAILVGPLPTMAPADFEALLKTQVQAVWTATHELLPIFRQAGGGKIVNICSIGGKIAVPHLGAYSTAKFALSGLSTAMNAEFAAENIQVTTVYPGLMRVGSAIQAVIKGAHEKEYTWFALGTLAPIMSVSADEAARRILQGVARGDAEIVFPAVMKAAVRAQAAFPELTAWASQVAATLLPRGDSTSSKTGAQSDGALANLPGSKFLIGALEQQQSENNEVRKSDPDFNLGLKNLPASDSLS